MRQKKWLWMGLILPLIPLTGALVYQKLNTPTEVPPPYAPVTWSAFKERSRLKMLVEGLGVKTVLDIPSVDLAEMRPQELGIKRYIGITEGLEEARSLQAQFGSHGATFLFRDIAKDPLPKADLILCWDKLCTLSKEEQRASLVQFKKSGARFVVVRHFPEVGENVEHPSLEYAPVNWKLPPFSFPEPLIQIVNRRGDQSECYALWNLEKL